MTISKRNACLLCLLSAVFLLIGATAYGIPAADSNEVQALTGSDTSGTSSEIQASIEGRPVVLQQKVTGDTGNIGLGGPSGNEPVVAPEGNDTQASSAGKMKVRTILQ